MSASPPVISPVKHEPAKQTNNLGNKEDDVMEEDIPDGDDYEDDDFDDHHSKAKVMDPPP
jgi:hypothetical protein